MGGVCTKHGFREVGFLGGGHFVILQLKSVVSSLETSFGSAPSLPLWNAEQKQVDGCVSVGPRPSLIVLFVQPLLQSVAEWTVST